MGSSWGNTPLISRLMKGVFHLRPPQPRFPADGMFQKSYIFWKEKGGTASLLMKDLTYKTVMLMALANADRVLIYCPKDLFFMSFNRGCFLQTCSPNQDSKARQVYHFYL